MGSLFKIAIWVLVLLNLRLRRRPWRIGLGQTLSLISSIGLSLKALKELLGMRRLPSHDHLHPLLSSHGSSSTSTPLGLSSVLLLIL